MTQPQRRSFWTLIIWGIVALAFLMLFFAAGGPNSWALDGWRPQFTAAVFLLGFVAFWIVLYSTRNTPGGQDERDALVQAKASSTALVVVVTYVFLTSVSLYAAYESHNSVPAGWLWFIAYTTFLLAWISGSAASLYHYYRGPSFHD